MRAWFEVSRGVSKTFEVGICRHWRLLYCYVTLPCFKQLAHGPLRDAGETKHHLRAQSVAVASLEDMYFCSIEAETNLFLAIYIPTLKDISSVTTTF